VFVSCSAWKIINVILLKKRKMGIKVGNYINKIMKGANLSNN
jgi:hypothetical protein